MKEKAKTTRTTKKPGSSPRKSEKEILLKELRSLIKDIDKDGLVFLLKQTKVLIYNKQVVVENEKIMKLPGKGSIKKPPFSDKITMDIKEADDNSSFIFVINKARKFFTLKEMRKIVKICHISDDEKDGVTRLFTWFKNNRGDVLIDIGIEKSVDPALSTIYNYILKRYIVKNG